MVHNRSTGSYRKMCNNVVVACQVLWLLQMNENTHTYSHFECINGQYVFVKCLFDGNEITFYDFSHVMSYITSIDQTFIRGYSIQWNWASNTFIWMECWMHKNSHHKMKKTHHFPTGWNIWKYHIRYAGQTVEKPRTLNCHTIVYLQLFTAHDTHKFSKEAWISDVYNHQDESLQNTTDTDKIGHMWLWNFGLYLKWTQSVVSMAAKLTTIERQRPSGSVVHQIHQT